MLRNYVVLHILIGLDHLAMIAICNTVCFKIESTEHSIFTQDMQVCDDAFH